jgi:hypothetical protein
VTEFYQMRPNQRRRCLVRGFRAVYFGDLRELFQRAAVALNLARSSTRGDREKFQTAVVTKNGAAGARRPPQPD